jgi:hypothetical protein
MDTKKALKDIMNIYKNVGRIVAQQRHGPGSLYALIDKHRHRVCSYTPLRRRIRSAALGKGGSS